MVGNWRIVLGLYLAGILAAAQLGKMAALAPVLVVLWAIPLVVSALLISTLEIGGALLGGIAGRVAPLLGIYRVLVAGLLAIAMGNLIQAAAPGLVTMLAARLIEAVGYLAIVVAAPPIIVTATQGRARDTAMALWSSFLPVGFAVGAIATGFLADASTWRMAPLLFGLLGTAGALLARRRPLIAASEATRRAAAAPSAAWCLALAFGCYTLFEVGALALLPTFFHGSFGVGPAQSATIASLASLATVLGSVTAASIAAKASGTRIVMVVGVLLPPALLIALFGAGMGLQPAIAVAFLLNAVSGVVPGLVFAYLSVAGGDGLEASNGLVAQCGAAGSLIGPPIFAAVAGSLGWSWIWTVSLPASVACVALLEMSRHLAGAPASCIHVDFGEEKRWS